MAAPKEVRGLVARFDENRTSYVSGPYNETQLRREFADPLFTALGWDVANEAGYAEAYKDVVHEDAIKIGGITKAPDYCFRIGGGRKFFVETKRPSVRIKDDGPSAYQLRRYAWSAKLPLSILTTFAELSVYDCRVKPDKGDPASTARILYLTCDEYESRWDELAGIFGKDAVLKGSFDRFAESTRAKRGTAEVDAAFLKDIETWREELARNLALRNPDLTQRELNFAVQRTIDRIVFLRICEDRGIEPYGALQALLNGQNVYGRLAQLFRRADERYNSGLFHFRPEKGRPEPPDELTLGLALDDKLLKDILRGLYYPDSPYEFSVLPADILGQVYEQFLGKVIRLTPGHRAVVEEKPEVRKAGGVYYTPTYIVDYIVKHTVGKLLEGKTPHEVGGLTKAWKLSKTLHPLRVLDPACGSGSFLLGAYQYLLDWYRDRYVEDGPAKHAKGRNPRLYHVASSSVGEPSFSGPSPPVGAGPSTVPSPPRGRGQGEANECVSLLLPLPRAGEGRGEGAWRLTTAERKRILLAHICGVDIDPQAVEVTKLSLLLKVLEGETQETLASFYRLFQERALPDLGANIKCGNSLIGPDFWEGKEYTLLDAEERYRINPFDWPAEFPNVFPSPAAGRGASGVPAPPRGRTSSDLPSPLVGEGQGEGDLTGGFDAVIGNPPYIRIQALREWHAGQVEYLKRRYHAGSKGNFDIYVLFVERGLELLNGQGKLGFILPNKFFNAQYGQSLREILSKGRHVSHIVHFGHQQVFAGASTYTALLFLAKAGIGEFELIQVDDLRAWRVTGEAGVTTVATPQLTPSNWALRVSRTDAVLQRIGSMEHTLKDVACRIAQGIRTSANDVYVLDLVEDCGEVVIARSPSLGRAVEVEREIVAPFLSGRSVKRYRIVPTKKVVIIPYEISGGRASLIAEDELAVRFPKTHAYLVESKDRLEQREYGRMRGAGWHGYVYPKNLDIMQQPKILVPDIARDASFALDVDGTYAFTSGYGLTFPTTMGESPLYVLGLINSTLLDVYMKSVSTSLRGGFYRYFTQYIEQLPIRPIDFSDPADKARHDKMVNLVQTMLDLHKRLAAAKTEHEKSALQRQIAATDQQIDQFVYDLYGLTEEEIRIVEEGTAR